MPSNRLRIARRARQTIYRRPQQYIPAGIISALASNAGYYGDRVAKFLASEFKHMRETPPRGPLGTGMAGARPRAKSTGTPQVVVDGNLIDLKKKTPMLRRKTRYATKGYRGPRYIRGKPKSQLYKKTAMGSIKKIESGGVSNVVTAKASYIGHSCASNQVLDSVGRAIIKVIANKGEWLIKEWGDLPQFISGEFWWINTSFKYLDDNTAATCSYYLDPTLSWHQHGNAFPNAIIFLAVPATVLRISKKYF